MMEGTILPYWPTLSQAVLPFLLFASLILDHVMDFSFSSVVWKLYLYFFIFLFLTFLHS
uniref:Uncharacterized protein n=1 Tax=Rhizophora mucronata TaxID=61149 RepID=A0A2P2R2E8_RHIMU